MTQLANTFQVAKDRFGQEIQVGDFVVFHLSGRGGELHYGKVRRIEEKRLRGKMRLTIFVRQVIDYSWSTMGKQLATKDSPLTNTNRMVVYPLIPQEVIDMFNEAGL